MTSGNRMPPVSGLMADALSASAFFVFKDFKDFKVLKVPNDLKAGFARATLMAFFQKTSCNILIDCTLRIESRWTV